MPSALVGMSYSHEILPVKVPRVYAVSTIIGYDFGSFASAGVRVTGIETVLSPAEIFIFPVSP